MQKKAAILKLLPIILILSNTVFSQNTTASQDDFFEFKRFLILPVGAYSEETGIVLGAGAMFFIEPPKEASIAGTNLSTVLMTSLKKQIQFANKLVYEPSIHWNLLAHLYLHSWPTEFYGIGNNLNEDRYGTYTLRNIRLPISISTDTFLPSSWGGVFRYGLELDGEYTDSDPAARLGIGYNLTYNSAERNDWPRKGSFVQFRQIYFKSNPSFAWKNLDLRMYIPLPIPEGTLALSSYLEDFAGKKIPIDRLAMPDGVGQLRGIKKGLLANNTSWVLQSELRTDVFWWLKSNGAVASFFKRCKGTVFYEFAKVADGIPNLKEESWHSSIGIGGRFLVNRDSKTHIRLDLSRVDSKDLGVAIHINEAF